MCFSATASFLTAAALTPIGLVALLRARQRPCSHGPLAALPLLFAGQQSMEGLVWLGLRGQLPAGVLIPASLTYLGFALALWPVWLPWCALRLTAAGSAGWRRQAIRLCWGLGWLLAAGLWLPLLGMPNRISPVVQHGSINYQVQSPGAELVSHGLVTLLYAGIICLPLLLTPCRRLRWFAVALALAFAVAQFAFLHAFSSVWCFFSAVLSLLVIWILEEAPLQPLRR